MAHGSKYRLPFRRRREGKTNYHRRLRLIKSRKTRVVIRASTRHLTVQFVDALIKGDVVKASAHSSELVNKFGYKGNTGNVPAAYLTGYLAGLRAKKAGLDGAILDVGIFVRRSRVVAAFKGVLDAGVGVVHGEGFIPEKLLRRLTGAHLEEIAKNFDEEAKREDEARKQAEERRKQAQKDLKDGKITQEEFDKMDFGEPRKDSRALYQRQFSAYLKNKLDPHKFTSHVEAVKAKLAQSVK
ncbi:MAG: 50S ribosomal protein L18 [Promethearchaeota archaeon]